MLGNSIFILIFILQHYVNHFQTSPLNFKNVNKIIVEKLTKNKEKVEIKRNKTVIFFKITVNKLKPFLCFVQTIFSDDRKEPKINLK